jgi:hypothetical protein
LSTDLTYFSVDVETSGLVPGDSHSHLLSIGAVAVSYDGWIVDTFYERVRTPPLPTLWQLPPSDPIIQALLPNSTLKFWKGVEAIDPFVAGEAYADRHLSRYGLPLVAERFEAWVSQYGSGWEDRIFVANPVSFDFAWTLDMFNRSGVPNPFHYRTLCLRSMAFGAASSSDWHANHLRAHRPRHPHHPLSDAYAQAQDLITLLGKGGQLDPLDEPYYENEPVA